MSYDPAIVGYYGKLVEIWAADNYPIELDYGDGDPLCFMFFWISGFSTMLTIIWGRWWVGCL